MESKSKKINIPENWEAIENIEEIVREETGDPKAGFNPSLFFTEREGRCLMIPCLYRGKKGKKGQETFTKSYKKMMIEVSYCPFTGKPLYKENRGMYYIRNEGYLGNALMWWAKDRNGYTCDIRNAHKFSKEEAENICKRACDTAYDCDYIDGLLDAQKMIIDSQYVDNDKRLFQN